MKYRQVWYWSLFLCWIIFTIVAVTGIEYLNRYQQQYLIAMEQENAREDLSLVRFRLESLMVSEIYILNSLPALIAINPKMGQRDWNDFAENIHRRSKHIRVIGLAPNDVIKYIYPPEGNEKLLDLNYRSVPEQWPSILKARAIKETFISGPVELFQGGQALIVRVPIFTDPPFNKRYWGVFSIVIDLQSLFEDAGVYTLNQQYNIALRGVNSSGESGKIFLGDQATFTNAFVSEKVHFPYGHWLMAASTKSDFFTQINWYQLNSARFIGYSALLAISLSFIALYRMYQKANQRSLHDDLTGLPNRRYFMFTIRHQFLVARSAVNQDGFALLNIDVDKFKWVNDQFGHEVGDKVLIAVAKRIQGALRASDVVARVGGDEFLVLLPRVMTEDDVKAITNTVERTVSHLPVKHGHYAIDVRVSIGYALYARKYATMEAMLKSADDKMYQVKNQRKTARGCKLRK